MSRSLPGFHRAERACILFALCATGLMAQEKPLPSSAEPPDAHQVRRQPRPPTTVVSPSIDQILRRLGVTRAEIARRKNAGRTTPLPASSAEPPEIAEMKRGMQASAAPARSPTIKEILDALRRQPGGAATIDRARRAGARIPRDASIDRYPQPRSPGASSPYFFVAGDNDLPVAGLQPTPTVRATRASSYQTVAGVGSISVTAFFPFYINTSSTWGPLNRTQTTTPTNQVGAPWDVKPYVFISFSAPVDGYYVINVVAGQSGFEARHYASGTYQLVQSFAKPAAVGTYSYPVLLNLAHGSHYFTWANLDYTSVSEVSATKF